MFMCIMQLKQSQVDEMSVETTTNLENIRMPNNWKRFALSHLNWLVWQKANFEL